MEFDKLYEEIAEAKISFNDLKEEEQKEFADEFAKLDENKQEEIIINLVDKLEYEELKKDAYVEFFTQENVKKIVNKLTGDEIEDEEEVGE